MYPHHIAKKLEKNRKEIGNLYNKKEEAKKKVNEIWEDSNYNQRKIAIYNYKMAKMDLFMAIDRRKGLKRAFKIWQRISDLMRFNNLEILTNTANRLGIKWYNY